MRKHLPLLWVPVFGLLSACSGDRASENGEQGPQKPLTEILPDTWESVTINVRVNSVENMDSTAYFSIPESDWKDLYMVKPPKVFFEPGNKYRREHRNFQDSIISMSRGMWNVFGDTLMMIEKDATYQYFVKRGNGLVTFSTLMDWDGDGQDDDEYEEVKRKVSISTGGN